MVAELSRKEIHRNAHSLEHQERVDNQGYPECYKLAKERIETLEQEKLERTAKSKAIGRFICSIRGTTMWITEFDETLWLAIVESVTIAKVGEMMFRFKNGSEVRVL